MKCKGKLSWRNTSLLLLTLSMTSACALGLTPPQPIPASGSFCAVTKPIYYDSKIDSSGTVKQIEAHNRKFVCLCEGDCPKPAN